MTEYRHAYLPGASWFFTVNLAERKGNTLLVTRIEELRQAFGTVMRSHPVKLAAVVILPDHLHCVRTLPEGDADYSTRWNLIKGHFSRGIAPGERVSESRGKRRERGVATPFLGASIAGLGGFQPARGLRTLESGPVWLGDESGGLAVFEFRQVCRPGRLTFGLAWGWHFQCHAR